MKSFLLSLIGHTLLSLPLAAYEVDKDRLRAAAQLPRIHMNVGIAFNFDSGVYIKELDPPDVRADVAALEKAMKRDASDAVRHLRIAELYYKADDSKKADAACERAIALYRETLKTRPDDGVLLGELGMALYLLDAHNEEAEKLLRRAVKLAPRDWYTEVALGQLLADRAIEALMGKQSNLKNLLKLSAKKQLGAAPVKQARKQLDEALLHFNRAIELAPKEPKARQSRVGCQYFRAALHMGEGEQLNRQSKAIFDEMNADIDKLCELTPDDYKTLGVFITAEALLFLAENGEKLARADSLIDAMPETQQQAIQKKLQRVQELTKNENRKLAAEASVVLATSYFALADLEKTSENLRRAVALNPDQEYAWDFLSGVLTITQEYEQAVEVALNRIKHKDNSHNRLIAAKAFEKREQFDKAEEQARLGLKKEPKDIGCTLALAALSLKESEGKKLDEARRHLDAAEKSLQDSTPENLRASYQVLRAISQALSGEPAKARQQLRDVLKREPDNVQAKEVLSALEE